MKMTIIIAMSRTKKEIYYHMKAYCMRTALLCLFFHVSPFCDWIKTKTQIKMKEGRQQQQ